MADFASTQQAVTAARGALDRARIAATAAATRASETAAALKLAIRRRHLDDHGAVDAVPGLEAAATEAAAALEAAQSAVKRARAAVIDASGVFAEFSDPRRTVTTLSSSSPFLLFPVRIETRFRTLTEQSPAGLTSTRRQLWVRIYPDDCSIDTFEPLISKAELDNTRNYWMNVWRAGGVENDERGAWRNLVAAHGAGRAGWLADTFQPLSSGGAAPRKIDATDVILVIPTAAAPSAADVSALAAYWQAVWLADGNATKLQAARSALQTLVGAVHADELTTAYVPFNLRDTPAAPLSKADVRVSTAFLIFPPDPDLAPQSWSRAPEVRHFPDRFVVVGLSNNQVTLEALGNPVVLPLQVGPDPSGDPNDTIRPDPAPDGPDLFVPDGLKWMVDFDRAVAAGMGIAIDLTPDQAANGFDLLLVLGLQLSVPPESGPAALEELLAHHQAGRSGLELIRQGMPAHNTPGTTSGHTRGDDADTSFNDRKKRPLFTDNTDPAEKRDGQWLAEFLGLDPAFVAGVRGSDGVDQQQTRAMQTALWPATIGYWLNTLFTSSGSKKSMFSDDTIERVRLFFTRFVSGRGALPAIRIGGQPYGILPTTAFSKIQWYESTAAIASSPWTAFLGHLYRLLRQIDVDWTAMSQRAHWVGEGGDPHQTLLDVLAHHPSSVEYYSRHAQSLAQLYNMMNVWAAGPAWRQALGELNLQAQAIALLQRLGQSGSDIPDLLNHFFVTDNPRITTIVDDRPLSETDRIRAYTDNGRNYIQWMVDAAGSLDTLRAETGFTNNTSPRALLYLYLRHALLLGYYEASYHYHRNAGVLAASDLLTMRIEPPFIHVAEAASSESRFAALYKTDASITGSPTRLVSDFISSQIGGAVETAHLAEQVAALTKLAVASTAQLERAFAEHIDTCSYRYDAWLLGLANEHIAAQRAAALSSEGAPHRAALLLGAYAWVEDLRPSPQPLTPAQVAPDVAAEFPGNEPLMTDPIGGGYIHAPSMSHATTAAVLRSGYLANAGAANPDTLAVNLSSDRVRLALTLLEGIRNGQSLGALLGYRFERGLHDRHALAEVDRFIYPLRKAFPLVADALASTKTDPNVAIEAIEARNVLDGRKLVDRVQTSGIRSYPFGLSGLPGVASAAEQQALDAEIDMLLNTYDAVADLALAEGVYQAVQGNFDRVASTIEAYTTGNFPPEPQVAQTPPDGITLTHRFAVQLKTGVAAPPGATPRAQAEPAVDEWLARALPPLNNIGCTVAWTDPVTATPHEPGVTVADLGLRPLDLLYLLKPDDLQVMTELDDRILRHVITTWNPRPDAILEIRYLSAGSAPFSLFETAPLLRGLRTLVTHSRPLRATDVLRASDVKPGDTGQLFVSTARLTTPLNDLKALGVDIDAFLGTLAPSLDDPVAHRAAIIANVDASLAGAVTLLERAARFSMPSSGWGFAYSWRHTAVFDLLGEVAKIVSRWTQRLGDFSAALIAYDNLPPATSIPDRFAALQAAELLVSSHLDPLLATPALVRSALDGKGTAFQNRLDDFKNVLASSSTAFASLFNAAASINTIDLDSQPFDLSSFGDRAVIVTQDVWRLLSGQSAAVKARVDGVQKQLDAAAAAASDAARVDALQAAAKQLLGDDFQVVPEFTLSAAQAGEWANALSGSPNLLTYLKNTLEIDFPVDEWLYGVARVRPMAHSWETVMMLHDAFGINALDVVPIQLPFSANDSWLALQYPDDYEIDTDRLLFTCAYSVAFNPNARQAGLLLDEWTEVIPSGQRDTAITFNYQRPDNEPPQAMLLVTAASSGATWRWSDLVDALVETLALAKKRAVEPAFIDNTVYSRFLPATVMASTSYAITIASALTAALTVEGATHA